MRLKEQLGYKRLAILISVFSFILIYILLIVNVGNFSPEEVFFAFPIASAIIGLLTFISVRITYLVIDWIIDGFRKDKESSHVTLEHKELTKTSSSSRKKASTVPERDVNIKKRKLAETIITVLAIVAFFFFTPFVALEAYKVGAGSSFLNQMQGAGIKFESGMNEIGDLKTMDGIRMKAKKEGTIYAFLFVIGLPFPILGLSLATTRLVARINSRKERKYFKILFGVLCVWGAFFTGLAFMKSSFSTQPIYIELMTACLYWLGIAAFFGIIIFVASAIRRFGKHIRGKK